MIEDRDRGRGPPSIAVPDDRVCAIRWMRRCARCDSDYCAFQMFPSDDDVSQRSRLAGGTGAWLDNAMAFGGAPLPSLGDLERRYIARVLQEVRGNRRRAARILGITRWSLDRRLRKYGLPPRAAA
ncbi:MAG TPA: helix-turn-helix domain-containing protein [Candidatus Binatia bacterium]|nr:helix-turn-helix domain-containing protein [Candidatus Binatia bacterium]